MEKKEQVSMLFVKELIEIQKNAILSFFKETISSFNERLDNVIKDVQDLKTSQSFHDDICKERLDKVEGDIKELSGNLVDVKKVQKPTTKQMF